ncbi:ABC transporter permease [Nocardia brevicatena]|uniref:ABC transporter permease n=1 Tax=Nocardia brevicatena TaxID=37327 RepID=UPI000318B812|nr:ABC transporter permease [Nocardia brevicatena]
MTAIPVSTDRSPFGGFLASIRAETLRLRGWPAFWIVLGTWIALNLVFTYLFNYLAYSSGEQTAMSDGLPPDRLLPQLLPSAVPEVFTQGMAMFGGALMLILGALTTGSGYGWGTWKTVLTQGPSRTDAATATLGCLFTVAVGVVLTAFAVDLGVATLIAFTESQPIVMPTVEQSIAGIGTGVAILGMWTLAGALIGAIARGPALAVGLGLVWVLVVETLLRGVENIFSPISVVTDHLPGTAAGSLAGAMRDSTAPTTPGVLDILGRGEAALVLLVYLAVFGVGTVWLVRTRDLA